MQSRRLEFAVWDEHRAARGVERREGRLSGRAGRDAEGAASGAESAVYFTRVEPRLAQYLRRAGRERAQVCGDSRAFVVSEREFYLRLRAVVHRVYAEIAGAEVYRPAAAHAPAGASRAAVVYRNHAPVRGVAESHALRSVTVERYFYARKHGEAFNRSLALRPRFKLLRR